MLGGVQGDGKSTLCLDIAARLSKGRAWPDGGQAPLGRTLLISAEDGLGDTIKPRLDSADADLSMIAAWEGIQTSRGLQVANLLDHQKELEAAIEAWNPILVVIDPINAFIGHSEINNDASVRAALGPLVSISSKFRTAIVCVCHLRKGAAGTLMERFSGSTAYTALARTANAVIPDRFNPTQRIFRCVKNNLCKIPYDLRFDINEGGAIRWLNGVAVDVGYSGDPSSEDGSTAPGADQPPHARSTQRLAWPEYN